MKQTLLRWRVKFLQKRIVADAIKVQKYQDLLYPTHNNSVHVEMNYTPKTEETV